MIILNFIVNLVRDSSFNQNFHTLIVTRLSKTPNTLFGANEKQHTLVLKWLSYANTDLWFALSSTFFPLVGRTPYNKKAVEAATLDSERFVDVIEKHLAKNTYLVGERVTVADYHTVAAVERAFRTVWGKDFISKHPAIYRWFNTVINQKPLSEIYTVPYPFRDEPIKYTPPEKPKKAEAKKAEPKKAQPKPKAEEPEDPPAEKKAAHPLAALGQAKVPIDEWKRTYSNEETREVALPWFWEHYDPEEYSLWKVTYKYNDELTLTFMSNNLIGGFFNRLSASTKYLFGCLVVYGENNNNGIEGAFLVRGQEYLPAFDVAPDWESYEFTKLDASKPEDKAYVEDLWAWDKPIIVDGKSREIADGKVLK